MKFLIFNVLVFFALGYLLTSNSNQNFKSWFSDKKDQITNLSKKDYVDKLKTAVSSNNTPIKNKMSTINNTAKKNLSENKINDEEKFQKEMLTQIKKLNDKINKNIKDLSKPEKKISQDNVLSKGLNSPKETSNQKVQIEKLKKEVENLKIDNPEIQNLEKDKIVNKFLTPQQRGQALAEIITDLEIYSIKGILN